MVFFRIGTDHQLRSGAQAAGGRLPAAGLGAAEAQRDLRNLQNSFPLPIYGDGEQTRDFIFVKDVVAANAFIATQPKATGVFNVAYGKKITINELCATICRLIGSKSEIKHATERAGDVKHSMAAIDRLRAAGFSPASDFQTSLQSTINETRSKN